MVEGLKRVEEALSSSSAKMAKEAEKAGRRVSESFGKGAKDASGGFMKAIGGFVEKLPGLLIMFGGPLLLAKDAFEKAAEMYLDSTAKIKELTTGALEADTSFLGFRTLAELGGGVKAASEGLLEFQRHLAEAKNTSLGVRTELEMLALNGKQLADVASTDMMGAVGAVADRIALMGNSTLQAHAAMQVFGKSGALLLPTLVKGSAGLQQMQQTLDHLGLGFSKSAYANIRAAEVAGKQLLLLKEGFVNQITIAMAPVLAEIAERLVGLQVGSKGFAESMINAMKSTAMAIAYVADNLGEWRVLFKTIEAGWLMLTALMLDGIAKVARGIGDMRGKIAEILIPMVAVNPILSDQIKGFLPGLLNALPSAGGDLAAMAEADRARAAKMFQDIAKVAEAQNSDLTKLLDPAAKAKQLQERNEAAARLFGEGLGKGAGGGGIGPVAMSSMATAQEALGFGKWQRRVTEFFNSVQKRFAESGFAAGDAFLNALLERMSKLQESVRDELDAFRAKAGDLFQMAEAAEKLWAPSAQSIVAGLGGPFGMLGQQALAGQMGQMLKQQFEDNQALAWFKQFQALESAFGEKGGGYRNNAAMEFGSREAYSAIEAFKQQDAQLDVQAQMKKLLETANKRREEQIRVGKDIAKAVKAIDIKTRGF